MLDEMEEMELIYGIYAVPKTLNTPLKITLYRILF
jgi:hypothetical protein